VVDIKIKRNNKTRYIQYYKSIPSVIRKPF